MTGRPVPPHPPARRRRRPGPDPGPRPVTELLPGALERLTGGRGAPPPDLFARWEEIAGPDLAPHLRPVRLADGVLAVRVDQPARATLARASAAALLARVTAVTGERAERLEVSVSRR